ncbi:MAG: BTAD domain-containing putative transcriptional regulator [Anaerolineae bacterium]
MTPAVLRIALLGGCRVEYDAHPVAALYTPRLQALLAHLCLYPDQPQSRQRLAFHLWPDTPESHARNNLRQLLFQLRHALPNADDYLTVDGATITWRAAGAQEVDVRDFAQALLDSQAAEARGDTKMARRALAAALALYQGDLLPDCYDDWIAPEREQLRERCRAAHARLARLLEGARLRRRLAWPRLWCACLDPLDKTSYGLLMRLHALSRDRAAVRRVYLAAVETLAPRRSGGSSRARRCGRGSRRRVVCWPRRKLLMGEASPEAAGGMVGRRDEWQRLLAAWRDAASGAARLALIGGEPTRQVASRRRAIHLGSGPGSRRPTRAPTPPRAACPSRP